MTDGERSKLASVISIHALHEESDVMRLDPLIAQGIFQSTLSMRRATAYCIAPVCMIHHISIHALHEESDVLAS